jgi:hypothetical protein
MEPGGGWDLTHISHASQVTCPPALRTLQLSSKVGAFARCRQGDVRTASRIRAGEVSASTASRDMARCWAMITMSRRAWNIDMPTKRRKSVASLPAARSAGATAKWPTRVGSQ